MSEQLTDAENWSHIVMRISEESPEFKKMLDEYDDQSVDRLIIPNGSFGLSLGEVMMLGLSVTYATRLGHDVTVLGDALVAEHKLKK